MSKSLRFFRVTNMVTRSKPLALIQMMPEMKKMKSSSYPMILTTMSTLVISILLSLLLAQWIFLSLHTWVQESSRKLEEIRMSSISLQILSISNTIGL